MSTTNVAHRRSATFDTHRSWELIAARIAVRIEESGMTGKALSESSGVSPNQIQSIKNGSQMPLVPVLRLARALGVTIDDLIPDGVR